MHLEQSLHTRIQLRVAMRFLHRTSSNIYQRKRCFCSCHWKKDKLKKHHSNRTKENEVKLVKSSPYVSDVIMSSIIDPKKNSLSCAHNSRVHVLNSFKLCTEHQLCTSRPWGHLHKQ